MTYFSALNILNLKEDFTKEELIKNYQRLMSQYSSYNLIIKNKKELESFTKKIKIIREAYSILIKSIVKISKSQYIEELYQKLLLYTSKSNNMQIHRINKYINSLINQFHFTAYNINDIDYIIKIDKLYYDIIAEIKKEFENFKIEFYNLNNLNLNEIDETLNYDCSLDEFYNQLLLINKKYKAKQKLLNKITDK